MVEFGPLLLDISADAPCGENLEYDPAFVELERLSQGKDEVQYGDTVVEAEPPDWKAVVEQALLVLERTRDLRVATILANGLLETEGLEGFANALTYTADLLEQQWEAVHPQLDPEDDNDPTLRVNTLGRLREVSTVLRAVRHSPLISSRAIGNFTLRDFEIAMGESEAAEDSEPPSMDLIAGAAADVGTEEIDRISNAVSLAIDQVARIENMLTEKVGAAESIDLEPLSSILKKAKACVGRFEAVPSQESSEPQDGPAANLAAGSGAPPVSAVAGEIKSTDDVKKLLEKICEFYTRHEPSSPVPLLLRRASNLVAKNFFEIIEDLAPDAVDQVQRISGVSQSDSE